MALNFDIECLENDTIHIRNIVFCVFYFMIYKYFFIKYIVEFKIIYSIARARAANIVRKIK